MIVAGIDCGLAGALCFMRDNTAVDSIYDMPIFELLRGGKKKRELDAYGLALLISDKRPGHAFVEKIWGRPHTQDGGYAQAPLLISYGIVKGVLAGLGIPITEHAPRTWKKALAVPSEKDGARARASQLLPTATHHWPLKKHDGRAESALIALYGLSKLHSIGSEAADR